MWQVAAWMGHSVRYELTREGLLVYFANHYTSNKAIEFELSYYDVRVENINHYTSGTLPRDR